MGLPKPVEELVFSMKVGELGGPVRGNQGFHVIKLMDRRAKDVKPLAEVREELRNQLRQKEMERQTKIYLDDLRRKTLVDVPDVAIRMQLSRAASAYRPAGQLAPPARAGDVETVWPAARPELVTTRKPSG